MRILVIPGLRKMSIQSFWRIMKPIDPPQEMTEVKNKLICKQEERNEVRLRSRKEDEYDDLVVLMEREGGKWSGLRESSAIEAVNKAS